MFSVVFTCMTCDLEIRSLDANEASVLYKIKPEMASVKSSYVHLVAGGYVSSKLCCFVRIPLKLVQYRRSVACFRLKRTHSASKSSFV